MEGIEMTTNEIPEEVRIRFGMIRVSNEEFRTVEWLRPKVGIERLKGMKKDETKEKGSDQPPTKVGLDDERSKTGEKKGDRGDVGSITDKVMEDQSKHHEVQRV